ncbi:MAG: hypothetical protein JJT90_14160 [Ectothiorhodospiraceae bacterium]|nr:hypothetical protein [Ectothiorhodospiraceae bacterium]
MGALFTISYWITLVTVIPGLVTLAVIWGAFAIIHPELLGGLGDLLAASSEWFGLALAVTAMVLTQALGIVLEELLVRYRCLGRPPPTGGVDRYAQYSQLYTTLVRLSDQEDTHGHLRRTVAQLFLTINTLVSFSLALAVSLVAYLLLPEGEARPGPALAYAAVMLACLGVSYVVAVIRFREMARSLAIVRAALEGRSDPPENNTRE